MTCQARQSRPRTCSGTPTAPVSQRFPTFPWRRARMPQIDPPLLPALVARWRPGTREKYAGKACEGLWGAEGWEGGPAFASQPPLPPVLAPRRAFVRRELEPFRSSHTRQPWHSWGGTPTHRAALGRSSSPPWQQVPPPFGNPLWSLEPLFSEFPEEETAKFLIRRGFRGHPRG